MPETLIVENAIVVTMDPQRRVIKDGAVVIEAPFVVDVGKTDEVKRRNRADQQMKAGGKVVLPGLVDCHQHTTQMLARGLADDVDLGPWLYERILPYEAALKPDEVHTSALLCCVEMIRNGTTSFADPGGYHMDKVAQAIEESGLRGTIAQSVADRDVSGAALPPGISGSVQDCLRQTKALFDNHHGKADGRVRVSAGLRSDAMVSPELVMGIDDLARKNGTIVQMHSANTKQRVDEFERTYHKGVFEYFDSLGVLGSHWLMSHAAVMRNEQVKILSDRRVNICHLPGSSLHGAYGASIYGKFPELLASQANVCLGCDAAAANNSLDMFMAMRQAATVHKEARASSRYVTPEEALEMATLNGSNALSIHDTGSIQKGKKADLIIVGIMKPNSTPLHDFSIAPTLAYSVTGADVETVLVDGRIVMADRHVTTVDVDDLVSKAQRAGERIVDRSGIRIEPRWRVS